MKLSLINIIDCLLQIFWAPTHMSHFAPLILFTYIFHTILASCHYSHLLYLPLITYAFFVTGSITFLHLRLFKYPISFCLHPAPPHSYTPYHFCILPILTCHISIFVSGPFSLRWPISFFSCRASCHTYIKWHNVLFFSLTFSLN